MGYSVSAHWDDEAKVWWSESNIPGLVIEAETLPEFLSLLKDLAPEMLADNVGGGGADIPIEFSASGRMLLSAS